MPIRDQFPDSTDPITEDLRQGTRKQFISEWTLIGDGLARSFAHELGEVPWLVSVVQSSTNDGARATERGTDATYTKNITEITVTSAAGEDKYFQVRAM